MEEERRDTVDEACTVTDTSGNVWSVPASSLRSIKPGQVVSATRNIDAGILQPEKPPEHRPGDILDFNEWVFRSLQANGCDWENTTFWEAVEIAYIHVATMKMVSFQDYMEFRNIEKKKREDEVAPHPMAVKVLDNKNKFVGWGDPRTMLAMFGAKVNWHDPEE